MSSKFVRRVAKLINNERAKLDLDPLKINSQLSLAAQEYSESMAEDDFVSHTGADGSSPFERMIEAGYQYRAAGENLAAGFTTPKSVMAAWMNSSGHRSNILNPNFTEVGIGYEFLAKDTGSTNYTHYWSQSFGTPL